MTIDNSATLDTVGILRLEAEEDVKGEYGFSLPYTAP